MRRRPVVSAPADAGGRFKQNHDSQSGDDPTFSGSYDASEKDHGLNHAVTFL